MVACLLQVKVVYGPEGTSPFVSFSVVIGETIALVGSDTGKLSPKE